VVAGAIGFREQIFGTEEQVLGRRQDDPCSSLEADSCQLYSSECRPFQAGEIFWGEGGFAYLAAGKSRSDEAEQVRALIAQA
jgi:hypothetical protein